MKKSNQKFIANMALNTADRKAFDHMIEPSMKRQIEKNPQKDNATRILAESK